MFDLHAGLELINNDNGQSLYCYNVTRLITATALATSKSNSNCSALPSSKPLLLKSLQNVKQSFQYHLNICIMYKIFQCQK